MKTVTNYAEKKAKQFLNLLQGYTKGIRFTAILILLLMGVNSAWGNTTFQAGEMLFYDFSAITGGANWSWNNGSGLAYDPNAQNSVKAILFTAQETWTIGKTIAKTGQGNWANITFTDRTAGTNCIKIGADGKSYTWTTHSIEEDVLSGKYIMVYGGELDSWGQSEYWFLTESNDERKAAVAKMKLSIKINNEGHRFGPVLLPNNTTSYIHGHWNSVLKCSVVAGSAYVVRNTGASTTYFTSKQASGGNAVYQVKKQSSSPTTTLSPTCPTKILQGEKLSFSHGAAGVSVVGNTNTVKYYLQNGTTYTEKTLTDGTIDVSDLPAGNYSIITLLYDGYIYVKASTSNFTIESAYDVTFANDGNGTTNQTGTIKVGSSTGIVIDATPSTDYEFKAWESSNGGSFATTAADASNTFYPTANTTLTATFRSTVTNSLTVAAGAGIASVTGSTDLVTLGSIYAITATPKTGYTFSTWTANPAENATFESATTANTTVTVNNGSVTVTASATENLYDITVQSSDNNHGTVTQSTDKAGIATTITITATPAEGCRFVNWTTATAGITIANATDASTTVTATATGTITANFELIPPTTIYLKPNSNWKQANARFAIYCWNPAGNTWFDMTKIDCDGNYYTAEVPSEYSDFKFVRMNPATNTNNWDNKWNETGNLIVPKNDNILFSISSWDSGSWGAYTAPTYNITLDRQDGTTGDESVIATYGSAAPSAEMPTRTGYTFEGYYTETNGQGTLYIDNTGVWQDIEYIVDDKWIEPACDLTLYAKWTAKTYAITLDANDGESNGSATVTYNSNTVTITSYPTRTDYRCEGYYTAATDGTLVLNADGTLAKNVSGYTDANGNWIKDEVVTLYAQWIYDVTEYIVTFGVETGSTSYGSLTAYNNNNTSDPITSPAQVRSGQSITFTATPETGYLVEGWYTDAACTAGKHDAGSTAYTTSITGETSVYVKFVEPTWLVSFVASTGGTVSPAEEQTVGVITGVNISATPETGYTFASWTSSAGGEFGDETAAETTFKPTAETTVTANFTENLFAITVTSKNDNLGTVTKSTDKAGIATAIEITATSKLGCRFVKWTATSGVIVADENSATTTITTTCEGSLTAHFEKMPPQTIYLNPGSWTSDSARFSVYYWKGNDNAWAEMVKVDANSEYYTVDIPAGCQDIMMVRLKPTEPENKWENVWNQSGNLTIPTNGNNLYELDNKTVTYLHLKPNENWKSDQARFAAYFFGNGEKWVDLVKKGDYYTCEIPTDKNYPNVIFCRMNPAKKENNWDNDNKWNQTGDLTIDTKNNLYTLNDDSWDAGSWSRLWDDSQWSKYTPSTTIQEKTGDYRMVYVDSTKFHPAHSISKITEGTKKDTVSFYINKDGQNPAILLQQCTTDGTTIEWNTIDTLTINGKDGNGVYNFVLEQTNVDSQHTAQILVNEIEPYNGNYYIRTYCTKGGWDNYTENPMTYSETALIHSDSVYDYYFCEWILRGKNIKYAVANDYSLCISDTLSSDDITNASTLPADANVRFTWNSQTNTLSRAYLAGSTTIADRYLVLIGNEYLKDTTGTTFPKGTLHANETTFADMGNWLYQLDVKANRNTFVKLTADYNKTTQYFKGSASDTVQLIKGKESEDYYTLRLIYDFKTNYLISALVDDDTEIADDIEVDEVMIIRSHHEQAQTFQVASGKSITTIKAYGVMTFNKDTLNGAGTEHERALYWVSFPFDVNLGEAFGFGNYGEHWIMEYYDGKERAEKGLWKEPTYSYWKYITDPTNDTLKAGQGYVLCLDLALLGNDSEFWDHENTEIALYFPSNGKDTIVINNQATERETIVPEHTCTIGRDDRDIEDSNWNIIGVPAYTKIAEINSQNLNFYYQYIAGDDPETKYIDETNSYRVQDKLTFNTMHAYMVQFAGTINWTEQATSIAALAARKSPAGKDQYTLRLALQQEDAQCDHTFIRLQEDNATVEFDMNYDLCKIINSGANIYSMIGNVEVAANVLPVEERVIPLGLDIHETGNYTFAMPDGTDGITATLIDYETGTETNLLLADYTVELNAGIDNERFALRVRPSHVATEVENTILTDGNDNAKKYIIDGALYLLRNGKLYDAQGRMIQQ